MKKILLFYLIITSFSTYSQEITDSIVSTSKLWSMMSCGYGVENEVCCCNSKFIMFSGDSVIETLRYKKILESTDSLKKNWKEIGYIREENKKIYARKLGDVTDGLIYDFNVSLNDTIIIKNPFTSLDSIVMVVASIDSINLINEKKKRIILSNKDYSYEYWIEGIGSLMGVINSCIFPVGGFRKLLCYWNDNQIEYSNPEYDYCFYNNVTSINSSQKWQDEIIVFPNPVSKYLYFSVVEKINEPISLKLFDHQGHLIYSNIFKNEYSINLSNLSSGFYFFSLTSFNNKKYKNGKIIKR